MIFLRESRVMLTRRNSLVSALTYIVNTVLQFVIRTVVIRSIGIDYLGTGNVFSNLFAILSLLDFGLGTVLLNFLYKPVAENKQAEIAYTLKVFRRLLRYIICGLFAVGLLFIPVLPKMISESSLSISQLRLFFFLVLINHLSAYVCLEKVSLLKAQQKVYIIKLITTITNLFFNVVQLLILFLWQNYYLCLIAQALTTLLTNLMIGCYTARHNNYLSIKQPGKLTSDLRQKIVKYVKASFIYKLGSVVLNSTDSIIITSMFGTAVTGYFSNYVTLYTLINNMVLLFIEATLSSIANYLNTKTAEASYRFYRLLMLIMFSSAAFICACYLSGLDHFITLWIGGEYLLDKPFAAAVALNQFVFTIVHPIWIVRECTGEYVNTKWIVIAASICNIVFSLLLGKVMGVSGVVFATAVSYLLSIFWFETKYYLHHVFHTTVKNYLLYLLRLLAACIVPILTGFALSALYGSFFILTVKFLICMIVTVCSFYLFMHNCQEWHDTINYIGKLIKGK